MKPNKKSNIDGALMVQKRFSCYIEGVYTIGLGCWEENTPSKSLKAFGTKFKFGKERVHREVLSKSVRLMSAVLCAPKFEVRSP